MVGAASPRASAAASPRTSAAVSVAIHGMVYAVGLASSCAGRSMHSTPLHSMHSTHSAPLHSTRPRHASNAAAAAAIQLGCSQAARSTSSSSPCVLQHGEGAGDAGGGSVNQAGCATAAGVAPGAALTSQQQALAACKSLGSLVAAQALVELLPPTTTLLDLSVAGEGAAGCIACPGSWQAVHLHCFGLHAPLTQGSPPPGCSTVHVCVGC